MPIMSLRNSRLESPAAFLRRACPPVTLALAALLAIIAAPQASAAEAPSIENDVLRVTVAPDTGVITVLDKRNNFTFQQTAEPLRGQLTFDERIQVEQRRGAAAPESAEGAAPAATPVTAETQGYGAGAARSAPQQDSLTIAGVSKTADNQITVELQGRGLGAFAIELRDAEPATIFATLTRSDGAATGPCDPGYPLPFIMDKETGYVMQSTQGDGILLPLNELDKAKGRPFSFGNALPIYGVTDLTKGVVGVLETWRHRFTSADEAVYPQKIRYHFVTGGGFVALAKYYRGVVKERGDLITLRDKAKITPQVNDIVGGPVIYLWGHARSIDFARSLKEAGIDKALLMMNLRTEVWPDKYTLDEMHKLGFVVGRYVVGQGSDAAPVRPNTQARRGGEGADEEDAPAAASPARARGAGSRSDDGGQRGQAAQPAERPSPLKLIEDDLKARPFLSRFYDTLIPQHRIGGEDGARQIVQFFKDTATQYQQMAWSGEGYTPDWAFPGLHGLEGCMSVRTYISTYLDAPGGRKLGTNELVAEPKWQNRYKPIAMVGDVDVDQTFWDWQVNPVYRIPLLELVYHDCIFTTWVFRASNHRFNGGWRHMDLMNILYGNKPLWNLDVETWEATEGKKDALVESYKFVESVLSQVELEEMTDYRWLSDDKKVAMTSYANGVHVAVNFKDEPFEFEGKKIEPLSFISWKD